MNNVNNTNNNEGSKADMQKYPNYPQKGRKVSFLAATQDFQRSRIEIKEIPTDVE